MPVTIKNKKQLKALEEQLAEQEKRLLRTKFYYQAELSLLVAQINYTKKQIQQLKGESDENAGTNS